MLFSPVHKSGGLTNIFCKCPDSKCKSSFVGHKTFVSTTQLCHWSMKATTATLKTRGHSQVCRWTQGMWFVSPIVLTLWVFTRVPLFLWEWVFRPFLREVTAQKAKERLLTNKHLKKNKTSTTYFFISLASLTLNSIA